MGLEQVAISDLTELLHRVVSRLRLHSEVEAEELHDEVSRLDPAWVKPKPVTAPAQPLIGPDGQPVSPQAWAAFQTFVATQEAEARVAAAVAAAAAPTPQAAAAAGQGVPLTPQQAAILAAQGLAPAPAPAAPPAAAPMTPEQIAALAARHGMTVAVQTTGEVPPAAPAASTPAAAAGGDVPAAVVAEDESAEVVPPVPPA